MPVPRALAKASLAANVDRNIKQAHLSLSDEKFNAVAFVVLELGEKNEAEKDEYGTTF
jgi:holo-[acyl-carrier protein] synthase